MKLRWLALLRFQTSQDIRQKLTELANGGLTTAQRVIVKADFDKLMSQAYGFVSNSNFNGRNLLISDATNVNTISNLNGTNSLLQHDQDQAVV